ncbi:protein PFC0760c-like [Microplitis mediator]|uniref:protein PFC0760c-like n=1 Tax=Microplitis mediator TaxID=375433 RepID=UPI0025559C0A|nr:protein PFC0760c-like [Microplitis mediator]
MDIKRDYQYYVVEFSDPPYCDIDQYVCIPDSWIQLREIVDQAVVTKFPVENLSITKKRVKDGEVFSDAWSIYVAEVKYGTDSYEDAEKYIKTLTEKLINKQSSSGPVNNDDGVSKILKSLRRSKRIQSNLSVNKPQVSEAPSSYNREPVSEQLAAISTKIATHKKHTNGVATINSDNEVVKQTDALSESLNGEQLLSNTEHYLYEVTGRQENNDETLNNVDSIEDDNGPQSIAGNESPVNHDSPQLTNKSLDATIISEPISDTGNPGQIKNVSDLYFEEGLLFLDHTYDELVQHCTYLEKLMDGINNRYYSGSYDPLNTTIKDKVAPVVEEIEREEKEIEKKRQVLKRTQAEIGIIKRRETERNEQEIDDSADNDDEDDDNNDDDDDDDGNDNDDDDDDDYVKRKRFQSRTLTLPPEYDKNDSKWTLRYREYAPGLVELIEHTGVYINAVKLVNCKRLAKNSKTLARLLLVEIFTESALYTCSLTGVRAKAFDIDGTHVRPGLDENARTVLLTYVEQYAQANKWPKTANQSILNSIRNKMQEIRFKYNK